LVAEAASRGELGARALVWLVAAELLVLPVLAGLSFYALHLRIDQHGLTVERLLALIAAVLTALVTCWSTLSVILGRFDWTRTIVRANPAFLGLIALAAVAVLTPLLDPWSLSARVQYARLVDGGVGVKAFDFGYLKFKLGRHGRARLAEIRENDRLGSDPEIAKSLAVIDASNFIFEWQHFVRSGKRPLALLGALDSFLPGFPRWLLPIADNDSTMGIRPRIRP
jgi:hypothetical protein